MSTGGIAPADTGRWLDAGALAVGVGGALAPATLDRGVDSSTLAGRLRDVLEDLSRRAGS